jgi:hypothetical protein
MLAIAVLFFFGVYLLITLWVVLTTIAWAKRNNRSPLKWGGVAAFVMYNLVFWDWLPTVVAHQYYCATEAGFWVYKTPEQWKEENPGVAETLSPYHLPEQFRLPKRPGYAGNNRYYQLPDGTLLTALFHWTGKSMGADLKMPDGTEGYWLNERFNWIVKDHNIFMDAVHKHEQTVVDSKNNEVLARYIDFSTGYGNMMTAQDSRAMKFWMVNPHCSNGGKNQDRLRNFRNNFIGTQND